MEYFFLFPFVKNIKYRPRNARVIVENNVAPFFGHGVCACVRAGGRHFEHMM